MYCRRLFIKHNAVFLYNIRNLLRQKEISRWNLIMRASSTEIKPQNILQLHKRGLLEDIFPPASVSLPNQLLTRQCFYTGFDPTADSLHIGNLVALMMMLHCQRAGHDIIGLIGTATARLGDPSDHVKDREHLSRSVLEANVTGITNCIKQLFEKHEKEIYIHRGVKKLPDLKILNNFDWYEDINVIDFLSTTGRKLRIGHMMDKKFVRQRLESDEGLLLPEFLYQVFQAHDWLHLLQNHNCRFQFGGTDQLGNIHTGQHLIRRTTKQEVYGFILPLLTTFRGDKIGKTAGNAIWLSPDKTSPFEFYQYFFRQPDTMIEKLLKLFTFIELPNIKTIMGDHMKNPEKRNAQRILARNVCKLVHGDEGLKSAERCTQILFHGDLTELENLSDKEIDETFQGMKTHHSILEPTTTAYDIAVLIKAIPEGIRGMDIINKGGMMINGIRMNVADQILLSDLHILKNDLSLVTIGKTNHHIIKWKVPQSIRTSKP